MIGEVVSGRYRIVSRIGSGGAGEVFEAEDLELPRKVAVKFLAPIWGDDSNLRRRFLREAEALSALDHPHICTIFESGETEDGRLFIAMAYYPGQSLRVRLSEGPLPVSEAVSCAISIADGMDKAHRMGFLHRDLKPGNIVITEDGVVKVLDFGLAKLPDRTQMTETGVAMGTLAYGSPEQVRGERVDARSDIYSLGVILYQMVTGICPFAAPNAAATLQMVLNDDVVPPHAHNPELPGELDALIVSCMDRDPDRRPAGMAELRERLVDLLSGISPTSAARHRAEHVEADSTVRARRRRRVALPVLAAVALVLVVGQGAMRSFLGLDPRPAHRGVALMPLSADTGHADLARGLWIDLSAQLRRIAGVDPAFWALPRTTIRDTAPTDVAGRFGVSDLIVGRVWMEDEQPFLELTLRDARTQDVRTSGRWPLGDDGAVSEALQWLADTAGSDASVLPEAPDEWPVYRTYLLGIAAIDTNPRLARDRLDSTLALDPGFALARIGVADALLHVGDPASLDRADSLLGAEPRPAATLAENYALRSRIALARGDDEAGARLLRAAFARVPHDPGYRRELGAMLRDRGSQEAAEQVYRDALEKNPGYFGAQEDLGFLHYLRGEYQDSIDHYEAVIGLAPDHVQAYNMLGACHYALERWDEATAMFETSFERRENYFACSNLGTLYYMDRRFAEAAGMYELAREYNRSNHVVLGNLASALRWVEGRENEAADRFEEAIQLARADLAEDPGDAVTLAYIAGYQVMRHPEEAVQSAERALAAAPDDADVLYRAAVVYEEAGQRESALRLLGMAIEHGRPIREINHERLLDDLRGDSRYRLLLP